MCEYADRLVLRWQESSDEDERDIIFSRLVRHCMSLPVVRRARRQTFMGVASHSPRWADDEEQAIRRAIWRAARRWDPSRGVAFDAYVSAGLNVAIHDFWRQEAWIEDLQVHVPVSEWKRYRRLVASRSGDESGCPDGCPLDLWLACTPATKHDDREIAVFDVVCYEDDEEDD